jgi:hypothetical protein
MSTLPGGHQYGPSIMEKTSIWPFDIADGFIPQVPESDLLLTIAPDGKSCTLQPRDPATWVPREVTIWIEGPPEPTP